MRFYGVSNAACLGSWVGDVVELFQHRSEAEKFIAECLADVPEWADVLSVVEVDLDGPDAAQPSLS